MSSDTNALLRSIRRCLLAVLVLLGVGVVVLAVIGYDAGALENEMLVTLFRGAGWTIALVAGLALLGSFFRASEDSGHSTG